jgi:hypothetical protein
MCVRSLHFTARQDVIPVTWPRWNSRYSRSRIDYITDSLIHRHPASESRSRGLPPIGFQLDVPPGVMIEQIDPAGPDRAVVLRAHQRSDEGRMLGELELGVFSASFIIDRDGVLKELVEATAALALGGPATGKLLGAGEAAFAAGASGYRMDVVMIGAGGGEADARPACPYVTWLALASGDLVLPGGLFITLRSAAPTWPAATAMFDSLRISGLAGARSPYGGPISLPLVRGR